MRRQIKKKKVWNSGYVWFNLGEREKRFTQMRRGETRRQQHKGTRGKEGSSTQIRAEAPRKV